MSSILRVLVDARMLVCRFSGVARVVTSLIEELCRREDIRITALCGREPYAPWEDRSGIETMTTNFDRNHLDPLRRFLWERRNISRIIRDSMVDLFHATWNTGVPANCPVPTVLTVHDLIGWRRRDHGWRGPLNRSILRHALTSAMRNATRVTTVSEFVRRDLLATIRVDPRKVSTVYNAAGPPSAAAENRSGSDPPFALYVGGHESRKNVHGILATLDRFWNRGFDAMILKLTGSLSSLSPAAFRTFHTMKWRQRVHFIGQPTDAELSRLYRTAELLVCLSHDEGFGLPVLEAMAHGCPVVVSNRAALPEVVGGAGVVVDPDDLDAAAVAVEQIRSDSNFRSKLVLKGRERAAGFGWSHSADQFHRIYSESAGCRNLKSARNLMPLPDPIPA